MTDGFQTQLCRFPIPEIEMMGLIRIQRAGRGMPEERHERAYELLLLLNGSKRIEVEGQKIDMRGGDVLLIRPGERHGQREGRQEPSELRFIIFSPVLEGMNGAEKRALRAFLQREAPRLCRAGQSFRRRFAELWSMTRQDGLWPQAATRAHLILLLEEYRSLNRGAKKQVSEDIALVMQRIAASPGRIPAVSELAAWACLSEGRFKQKFAQEVGMTPREYILRGKLPLAAARLEAGAGAAELAEELGFSSARHLTSVFQRYLGSTPAQYLSARRAREEYSGERRS